MYIFSKLRGNSQFQNLVICYQFYAALAINEGFVC